MAMRRTIKATSSDRQPSEDITSLAEDGIQQALLGVGRMRDFAWAGRQRQDPKPRLASGTVEAVNDIPGPLRVLLRDDVGSGGHALGHDVLRQRNVAEGVRVFLPVCQLILDQILESPASFLRRRISCRRSARCRSRSDRKSSPVGSAFHPIRFSGSVDPKPGRLVPLAVVADTYLPALFCNWAKGTF